MARFLIKQVETYRVDNEADAKKFIEEQKQGEGYVITKYSSELKETKSKGEVIDSWYRVTLTKDIQPEKEPYSEFITVLPEVANDED